MAGKSGILAALTGFPSITLDEMDSIRLMNRVDTKYVTCLSVLADVLKMSEQSYSVLELEDGIRVSEYETLYYDTDALNMYLDHHNKRLNRHKVRVRRYLSSDQSFLEIKHKNNKGRTKKKRIEIESLRNEYLSMLKDLSANDAACSFISGHTPYICADLHPAVFTNFQRITLVNNSRTERLTIDFSLCFKNVRTDKSSQLHDAVIIEIKQDAFSASPMKNILLDLRVKPFRISKYCIAQALTDESLKKGRFLGKIKYIEKITDHKLLER